MSSTDVPDVPNAQLIYRTKCTIPGSYAELQDLINLSLPDNSKHDFKQASMEQWLRVASSIANSYLGQRFEVPLKAWSEAWVWAVCEIAFSGMVNKRGFNPSGTSESTLDTRHKAALDWIKAARDNEITPDPRLVGEEHTVVALMQSDRPRMRHTRRLWGDDL